MIQRDSYGDWVHTTTRAEKVIWEQLAIEPGAGPARLLWQLHLHMSMHCGTCWSLKAPVAAIMIMISSQTLRN